MRSRGVSLSASILLTLLAHTGCGDRRPPHERPKALPVNVFADTGRSEPLHVTTPPARPVRAEAWLTRVTPARATRLDLPEAGTEADTLIALPSGPAEPPAAGLAPSLKPPIPRERAPLAVPAGGHGSVELDVRVDERGRVTEARFAGGSAEPALVRAAILCATGMRFYPALLAGRPVAVWCRERFDFDR